MALDATVGGASADSFATLAEFQSYADAIGYDYSGSTDAAQEIALRKAAFYLNRSYRRYWRGYRVANTQSMEWPRRSFPDNHFSYISGFNGILDDSGFEIPIDSIPQEVKDAQCEAAILVLGGVTLEARLERGGAVQSKSVSAGPVSSTTTWSANASTRDRFTTIEGLLSALVTGHPGGGMGSGVVSRG